MIGFGVERGKKTIVKIRDENVDFVLIYLAQAHSSGRRPDGQTTAVYHRIPRDLKFHPHLTRSSAAAILLAASGYWEPCPSLFHPIAPGLAPYRSVSYLLILFGGKPISFSFSLLSLIPSRAFEPTASGRRGVPLWIGGKAEQEGKCSRLGNRRFVAVCWQR